MVGRVARKLRLDGILVEKRKVWYHTTSVVRLCDSWAVVRCSVGPEANFFFD